MILRRSLLPLGLLALLCAQLVSASNTDHDRTGYDILKNSDGKTPCDLTDDIGDCPSSRRARALLSRYPLRLRGRAQGRDHDPDPSRCTCNNVFFNVWSACLISEHQNAAFAAAWTQQCEADGFEMDAVLDDGYNIPAWALVAMPSGNATFDIEAALSQAASADDRWSKFQVITIVAVVCSLVGVVAIFVFLYRWRRLWIRQHGLRRAPWTFRLPRMPSGTSFFSRNSRRKIQQINDDDDDFVIDRDIEELEDNYEFVGTATSSRSRSGHIRLPSSPLPYVVPRAQPSFLQNIVPGFRRAVRSIPIPWTKRPVAVRALPSDTIFDIDGPNQRGRSESTLQNYRNPLKPNYAPRVPPSSNPSRSEPVVEEELHSDSDDEYVRPTSFPAGNETDRLINNVYPSRNSTADVMLISRSGNDFSMESGSGETTRPTPETRPPSQPKQPASRPRAPPAPQYPAPLPPASPRQVHSRQTSDNNVQGLGSPGPSNMAPLVPSSPNRPAHRLRQGSDDNMLGLSGVHRGEGSSSGTLPSAPNGSAPHLPIDTPSPLYVRRPSNEAFRSQNASHFRVPQVERMSGYSTDLEIPAISSPPYHPSPLRDERILAPLRGERYTPPPQLTPLHNREFERTHHRNVSSESVAPGRSDPVMLFSGPVRAAGYMRSPSQTRNDV